MEAIGIIVEYNPFHNGHMHHLQQARTQFPDATIIAVMSGHFLQRGIPAILNKWQRAELAIIHGVDIVIELPYASSVQRADIFARNAVQLLASMDIKALVFGSESADVETLTKLTSQPTEANDILGYYYIQTIQALGNKIQPIAIPRIESQYNQDTLGETTIASATAIRQALNDGLTIDDYVPAATAKLLQSSNYPSSEAYYNFIRHRILVNPDDLKDIALVAEGIENRLYDAALEAQDYNAWLNLVATTRYRKNHLNRLATHILTGTTWEQLDTAANNLDYLRVLGLSQRGQNYLRHNRAHFPLQVITSLSRQTSLNAELELRATTAYALLFQHHNITALLEREYNKKPILGGIIHD